MNKHELLDVIGEAQDKYVLQTIQRNKTSKPRQHLSTRISRKILLAAAIVAILVSSVYAAKYVGNLFVTYFQAQTKQTLTDSQIDYIQNSTQPTVGQAVSSAVESNYSVSVRSALTDGKIAYITLAISAPEDISLEDGRIRFAENPLLFPDNAEGLVLAPDGSSPDAMCDYQTLDDGDGMTNTASVLFKVSPFTENDSVTPFDGSIRWQLHVGGFDKVIASEDTPLTDGVWEFKLEFKQIDTHTVEFVSEPVPMKASVWLEDEYTIDCTLTSFTLSGLGRGMQISTDYSSEKDDVLDIGDVVIVMKDGTSRTLLRVTCPASGTKALSNPIILEEVDYILFQDGTKLYPIQ